MIRKRLWSAKRISPTNDLIIEFEHFENGTSTKLTVTSRRNQCSYIVAHWKFECVTATIKCRKEEKNKQ